MTGSLIEGLRSAGKGALRAGFLGVFPLSALSSPNAHQAHDLMPAPQRLDWQQGRLPVDARFTLASRGRRDERIDAALTRTLERLAALTGRRFTTQAATAENASLVVDATGPGLPVQSATEDESYELRVTPRQARLTAPNALGVLRGLETFLQLVRREHGRHFVPAVRIADRPRFPWRGLLIDPCRRWQPVEVIKRNLDAMAAVKLNVLHWHLSEDQGFRIESRTRPKLHERGSDGLYYTQEQVKDVIAYARQRGIRVVPEFDIPGHAASWLVGYPELGSSPGPYALARRWGVFDDILDPTRDDVYSFLDAFLGEMATLFPDAYIHIGGDEVTPRAWNDNPAILDYMYRNGLTDAADLQAHFNQRVVEILAGHGKKMVGWDEVLRPELPKSAVIQSWRGPEALGQAATLGYEGILSNGYYLDHMLPAAFHYSKDPLPPDSALPAGARERVLGGEACMWGEFVNPETIDSRIWPRAAAVAERLWSPPEVNDVDDMYRRLEVQSVRLEAAGATHRSSYAPMLKRLAGDHPIEPLQMLADVVTPVKLYTRGKMRRYTSATPLDRLVDAARPESMTARRFQQAVDRFLATTPEQRDASTLTVPLTAWRDNHRLLEPILSSSKLAAEASSLSKDLAALGELGLQAIESLGTGQLPTTARQDAAQRVLDRARKPRAEVEIAVLPGVRKLVRASEQRDTTEPAEAPPGH